MRTTILQHPVDFEDLHSLAKKYVITNFGMCPRNEDGEDRWLAKVGVAYGAMVYLFSREDLPDNPVFVQPIHQPVSTTAP